MYSGKVKKGEKAAKCRKGAKEKRSRKNIGRTEHTNKLLVSRKTTILPNLPPRQILPLDSYVLLKTLSPTCRTHCTVYHTVCKVDGVLFYLIKTEMETKPKKEPRWKPQQR